MAVPMPPGEPTGGAVVRYGDTLIRYDVRYARRKTVAIEVTPDRRVSLIAPEGSDPATLAALVGRRAPWITRQQRRFAAAPPVGSPRAYVSGESYRYLGRQYRLRVATGAEAGVRLGRTILTVTQPGPVDPAATRAALEGWFADEARRLFAARLAACFRRVARLGVAYPTLTIRPLATRWGSCSRAGAITLNLRLIQAPQPCLDYVILHELCHLQEHHHGKSFYALLDRILPDWRERRHTLNACEIH